jgi:hypothetical protein
MCLATSSVVSLTAYNMWTRWGEQDRARKSWEEATPNEKAQQKEIQDHINKEIDNEILKTIIIEYEKETRRSRPNP